VDLLTDTWRGILQPHRILPIALVGGAMILAEAWFTRSVYGVVEAALMCLGFLALGPWLWRRLFPHGERVSLWRIALFGFLGGLPPFLAWAWPYFTSGPYTFLTAGMNALVVATLFWAGAWGIGRDIEMEQRVAAERARAEEMTRAAERAQLMAIRAHLDPHFLFNTLNAIAEWCREDGEVAEQAVLRLSALLREVMTGVRVERWPLTNELKLVTDVWELHRIRDPDRFIVNMDLPDPLPDTMLPPMILLPLVENAVKHGPAAGHAGPMGLSIVVIGDALHIQVKNPGPFTGPREGGEGLAMVEKRLALVYDDARFRIFEQDGHTIAEVILPHHEKMTT
jgi:two-component system sensor histidine kinase AlgZ